MSTRKPGIFALALAIPLIFGFALLVAAEDTTIIIEEELLPGALPFEDASPGDWFYDAVTYIVHDERLMYGTSTEPCLFLPDVPVARVEIADALYHMAGIPDTSGLNISFDDVPEDACYADAVIWAAKNGIIPGSGGNFDPKGSVTRLRVTHSDTFRKRQSVHGRCRGLYVTGRMVHGRRTIFI